MKICKTCKKEKSLSSYYVHLKMKDGHLNICKACTVLRTTKYRNDNIEKVQAYDRHRRLSENISKKARRQRLAVSLRWKKNNKEKVNANQRRYRNGVIGIAHNAVQRTLKDERPSICNLCNIASDIIHGHHPDYNKPLEVVWCCPACHGKLHRKDSRLIVEESLSVSGIVDVTDI